MPADWRPILTLQMLSELPMVKDSCGWSDAVGAERSGGAGATIEAAGDGVLTGCVQPIAVKASAAT